jgi:hypothetical protein
MKQGAKRLPDLGAATLFGSRNFSWLTNWQLKKEFYQVKLEIFLAAADDFASVVGSLPMLAERVKTLTSDRGADQ